MSVYKLELEKASIIIKKETIVYDIPDGVTFAYSDFSDIENLKKVLPYINNGNYGAHILYGCKFPTVMDRSIKFRIANGVSAFNMGTMDNPVDCVNIDCERVTRLSNCISAYVTEVHFYNTENVETINSLLGSGAYDYIYGLDIRNCYKFTLGVTTFYLDYLEILNFGTHKDLVYADLSRVYSDKKSRKYIADIVVENSFNRAEAGYEPCTVKLYYSDVLTDEQIAKATSKGYTIS